MSPQSHRTDMEVRAAVPPNFVYTPETLAQRFDVPLRTVYSWRSTGKGPRGFRVGKFVRYRLEDVQAWEQEQLDKDQLAHAS